MAIGSRRTTPTLPVAAAVVSEPRVAPRKTPWPPLKLCSTSGRGGLVLAPLLPGTALPVDELLGDRSVHAFPPHVAVLRQGHVGEDGVLGDGGHGVGVAGEVGARRHAEVTVLRVDRPQPAVLTHPHP